MNIQAIEQFIAGAEEIDRKRKVIARVIGAVSHRLLRFEITIQKHLLTSKNKTLFKIELKNGETLHVHCEGIFRIRVGVGKKPYSNDSLLHEVHGSGGENAPECPLRLLSEIYKTLPIFVARAHNTVPEAGIKEYFDEIAAHAPTAS